MACGGDSRSLMICVWTTGSTTEIFVPGTDAMPVGKYESFRVELEYRNESGDIEIKRGVQYSDDGLSWDAATAFDTSSWVATEGYNLPTDWTDVLNGRKFFRLGVIARSSTAADNEQGRVTYMLDLKSR